MGKRSTLYGTGEKVPLTPAERAARAKARRQIVQACNRRCMGMPAHRAPFTMRHLDRCVGMARRLGLVDDAVLVTAGFRASHRPGQPEHIAGGRVRVAAVKARRAVVARVRRRKGGR